MVIVPVGQLQEGMSLAAPVLHPTDVGVALAKRDVKLDRALVEAIRTTGVDSVYVRMPGTESLDKHLAFHSSVHAAAMGSLIRKTEQDLLSGTSPASLCFEEYYRRVRTLTDALQRQTGPRHYYPQLIGGASRFEVHSVSVAHLSLLLGLHLGDYLESERKNMKSDHAREVINLGVAGLLHDVGKMGMPAALRERHVAEPPFGDQVPIWNSHARAGYEILHGRIESSALVAIQGHHLRFDGKLDHSTHAAAANDGKPIHIFARILAAADLFDRLSHPRAGVTRSNLEVFHLIRTRHAGQLDPVILRALIAVTPPIMPGTRIELADRTQAVVMSVDPAQPLFPIVQRLGKDGCSLSPVSIDVANGAAPDVVSANGTIVHRFSNGSTCSGTRAA